MPEETKPGRKQKRENARKAGLIAGLLRIRYQRMFGSVAPERADWKPMKPETVDYLIGMVVDGKL